MKVSVIGGGPVGLAYCALLLQAGHEVKLWSQTHPTEGEHRFTGALEQMHHIPHAPSLDAAVAFGDVILLARCAAGVHTAIDTMVPALRAEQVVIFSAELSFASLYLARAMRAAGRQARSVSWSTTVATAQRRDGAIRVGTIRDLVDIGATGFVDPSDALALCSTLFGARFRLLAHPIMIGLSNLNPPIHLANSLANLTRIERAEDWENYQCITPAVGRLIERLDVERCALAEAFGFKVRNVFEHYLTTFPNIRAGSVSEMAQQVHARAPGTKGPITLTTRYITEDVPFGLVPLCVLGRSHGIAMPLHEAGIALVSAFLGMELHAQNTMITPVMDEIEQLLGAPV